MNRPPVPPQHQSAPQPSASDHFVGEMLRTIVLKVAEDLEPQILQELMQLSHEDPRTYAHLRHHNDRKFEKLMSRNSERPQERPRKPNGAVDTSLESARATRALFDSMLKGGR